MRLPGYDLDKRISRDDISTQYLAHKSGQPYSPDQSVVIRILGSNFLADSSARQAFEKRARLASGITHPCIVPVLKSGVTPKNRAYFVMRNIKGIDLSAVIAQDMLLFSRRLGICLQICQALIYAHKNGILHSSLRTEKVVIDHHGLAHVSGFAIGMLASEQHSMAMSILRTSPNLPDNLGEASIKTDIYTLGALLYESLSGMKPDFATYQPASKNVAGFSPELDTLLCECMNKNPSGRPSDVQVIYHRLLRISAGRHLSEQQKLRAAEFFRRKNCLLLDVLKEDSESAVYLFENIATDQWLVVKVRSFDKGGYKEAQRLLHIKHPNIANVMAVTRIDNKFVVVTEYLSGGTLSDRLLAPWNAQQFLNASRGIAAGLAFALQHSVRHRHLRPSSIYFDEHDTPKVADFAFECDKGIDDAAYIYGPLAGTEQADVFSLGVVFHEMLLGKKPQFTKGVIKLSLRLRNLSNELQSLLLRMLDVNNKLACQRMADVVHDLALRQSEAEAVVRAREAFSSVEIQGRAIFLPWIIGAVLCLIAGVLFMRLW